MVFYTNYGYDNSRRKGLKIAAFILFLTSILIVGLFFFLPLFTYAYYSNDLSSEEKLINRNNKGVILLDRNDKPFFNLYEAQNKTFVPVSEISQDMKNAVIAVEDKDFYTHPGFSIKGIVRSLFKNFQKGSLSYGGSTLTQQLIKNTLLTPKKSMLRKLQEIFLSQEVERRFSKDQILEMYLNTAYFGKNTYGVEEAAKAYFGKKAKDLTLGEASILAGLLPSPSKLAKENNSDQAKAEQKYVLEQMVEQNYITTEEKDKALEIDIRLVFKGPDLNKMAPHFAMFVRDQLIERYGGEEKVKNSGFIVKTTLDSQWQKTAEKTVSEHVAKLAKNRASNGSIVAIDPKTGELKAMVGSKDWSNDKYGKVNVAVMPRQPGSSFKPIVYATAFENKVVTPATIVHDQPTTFGRNYSPQNFDGKFRGPVSVRRALSNSLNVPSVELMSKVGVPAVLNTGKNLGLTTLRDPSNYGFSLVLGAAEVKLLELTNAYAAFANYGEQVGIDVILEIEDKNHEVIYQKENLSPKRVFTPETAFLISSILSDTSSRAEVFGNLLNISRPAAVKTGTTQDFRDSLTIGYTPSLVIGVWIGNNDNTRMDNVAGSLGAAPVWKSLMESYLKGAPVENFIPTGNLKSLTICPGTELVITDSNQGGQREFFIPGTEPKGTCQIKPPEEATPSAPPQEAAPTGTTAPTGSPAPQTQPPAKEEQEKGKDNGKEQDRNEPNKGPG